MPDETADLVRLDGLDKLLEHRVRLAICVLLSRHDAITFSRFKALLEETDGNLGANLRRLEEAGYIAVDKRFEERKPVSWYSLTRRGRTALQKHVAALEALLTIPTTQAS
jgi:DNA-binding PadR family transcriptional regulator